MPRIRFVLIVAALILGAALATRGTRDPIVSLASLNELWADTLRDTDQIGMRATRVSADEEMRIGVELSRDVADSGAVDPADERYVTAVGQMVAQHVSRQDIRYEFRLIQSPEINAFALPGGRIFITTGMLKFVESEAELAAVLGHEISHVDLRHCIERYQYELKLRKAGMPEAGQMVEIAHRLATFSFSQYQESDADAQGERLAIEAGYDPSGGANLFRRMQERSVKAQLAAAYTPADEVVQAAAGALKSFFRSHPLNQDRIRDLDTLAARARRRLAGKTVYIGVQNLAERTPKSQREYPAESITIP